eukprot:scaffold38075_cov66-Phaeocystis_antarctica.AAC.1
MRLETAQHVDQIGLGVCARTACTRSPVTGEREGRCGFRVASGRCAHPPSSAVVQGQTTLCAFGRRNSQPFAREKMAANSCPLGVCLWGVEPERCGVEAPDRHRQVDGGTHRQRDKHRHEGHGKRVHLHAAGANRSGEVAARLGGEVAAEPAPARQGRAEGAQVGWLEQQRRAVSSGSAAPPEPEPKRPEPRLAPARRERHRQPLPLALVRQRHAAAAVEPRLRDEPSKGHVLPHQLARRVAAASAYIASAHSGAPRSRATCSAGLPVVPLSRPSAPAVSSSSTHSRLAPLAAACSGVMANGSPPEKRAAPVAGTPGSTRACHR